MIDQLLASGALADYRFAHAARAELCRRADHMEEARASYIRALSLTTLGPERRFLLARLASLPASPETRGALIPATGRSSVA